MEKVRYKVVIRHDEGASLFLVVDTFQPTEEQPCIVLGYNSKTEPNAAFLAKDFCERHNHA